MASFLQKDEIRSESPEKVQNVASGIIKAAGSLLKTTTYNTSALESKENIKVRCYILSVCRKSLGQVTGFKNCPMWQKFGTFVRWVNTWWCLFFIFLKFLGPRDKFFLPKKG